jgi:hypothetical protein
MFKEPYENENNKSNKKKPLIIELLDDNDKFNEKNELVTQINQQVDSNKTEKIDEVSPTQTTTTFDNFNKLNTEFDTLD